MDQVEFEHEWVVEASFPLAKATDIIEVSRRCQACGATQAGHRVAIRWGEITRPDGG